MESKLRLGWLAPVSALVLLVLLALALRGSSLVSPAVLNPDEGELLASGRRAALNLSPYVTYTTSTYLALWPAFLGLLAIVGVPMTLAAGHVLSGLAYLWISFAGWLVLSRRVGWLLSGIFVLPATAALLVGPGPEPVDFLAMGSELLPVSIVMAAAVILFAPTDRPSQGRLAAACALAGLAPWAKPQIVLLAATLCLLGYLLRRLPTGVIAEPAGTSRADDIADQTLAGGATARRDTLPDALVAVLAFAAPSALLLLLFLVQGTLRQFIDEPVAYIYGYLFRQGVELVPGHPLTLAQRVGALGDAIGWYPLGFLWVVAGAISLGTAWRAMSLRVRAIGVLIVLGPVAAAMLSLAVLSPVFPHYLNILFGGCVMAGMAGTAVARLAAPDRHPRTWPGSRILALGLSTGLAAVLVVAVLLSMSVGPPTIEGNLGAVLDAASGRATASPDQGSPLAAACPPRARVYVWGWAPELYAELDWTPASRYVAWWPLSPYGRPKVYRATLLSELFRDPPTCIVEAIGPSFYGYYVAPADGIEARMPDLANQLATCYQESAEVLPGNRPVTLWRWTGTCAAG